MQLAICSHKMRVDLSNVACNLAIACKSCLPKDHFSYIKGLSLQHVNPQYSYFSSKIFDFLDFFYIMIQTRESFSIS